jgi:hypothetical protein
LVGAGVKNSDPGNERGALAAIGPAGIVAWWQLAQSPETGMWADGDPAGDADGKAIIRLIP